MDFSSMYRNKNRNISKCIDIGLKVSFLVFHGEKIAGSILECEEFWNLSLCLCVCVSVCCELSDLHTCFTLQIKATCLPPRSISAPI